MQKKGIRASVEWAPREGNREADSRANGNVCQSLAESEVTRTPQSTPVARAATSACLRERGGRYLHDCQGERCTSDAEQMWTSTLARRQVTCQGPMVSIRLEKSACMLPCISSQSSVVLVTSFRLQLQRSCRRSSGELFLSGPLVHTCWLVDVCAVCFNAGQVGWSESLGLSGRPG